jgi:hypothetical protein
VETTYANQMVEDGRAYCFWSGHNYRCCFAFQLRANRRCWPLIVVDRSRRTRSHPVILRVMYAAIDAFLPGQPNVAARRDQWWGWWVLWREPFACGRLSYWERFNRLNHQERGTARSRERFLGPLIRRCRNDRTGQGANALRT